MIAERVICSGQALQALLRLGRRESRVQLVNFIQHEQRFDAPALHGLDDAPEQCADVCTTMPAEFRLHRALRPDTRTNLRPSRICNGTPE